MLFLRQHVDDVPGDNEARGVVADSEGLEVVFAALDLGAFLIAEVVGEQSALGFDHEVEPLFAVLVDQHSPVGIVGSQWREHLEPARQFRVDLHCFVLLELFGEDALDTGRVIDDMLVDRFLGGKHVLKVSGQFFLLEEFLRVIFVVTDALVLNAVHER